METKQLVKSLRYLNANRLLLDLNGGHDSHQNLWMTYEDSNGTGLQSLETITVFYTSFLVSRYKHEFINQYLYTMNYVSGDRCYDDCPDEYYNTWCCY